MTEALAEQAVGSSARRAGKVIPTHMAHFVVKTAQYQKMIEFFDAEVVSSNEMAAFLTFDEERHRVAIVNMPDLLPQRDDTAGVHHVAFSVASLEDLLSNYKRLRDKSIVPAWCVNHGPTTSMYYKDPDGSQVEVQTDNYETFDETMEFMKSEAYANNIAGIDFDPEELIRQYESGAPELGMSPPCRDGPARQKEKWRDHCWSTCGGSRSIATPRRCPAAFATPPSGNGLNNPSNMMQ